VLPHSVFQGVGGKFMPPYSLNGAISREIVVGRYKQLAIDVLDRHCESLFRFEAIADTRSM
jgi:hypothetical protein